MLHRVPVPLSQTRSIGVVTGIRSEYDLLYSTLGSIRTHLSLDLQLVVTGTHLTELYGSTVRQIEEDGFEISERVETLLGSDTSSGRAKSAGIQVAGLAQAFARLAPDILLAPCDREEALTTAMVGTYLGIPIAHLYGGDRTDSGHIDENVRHATTKLAHLHLVMTEEHRQRVVNLGEEPWRVYVVGHGGLDRLLTTPEMSRSELASALDLPLDGDFAVVIQHTMPNDLASFGEQMRMTLTAIEASDLDAVLIYPNSDAGSSAGIEVIRTFAEAHQRWKAFANLPRKTFVNLLRQATVLVGNSTCGIQEAPSLGLPAINVGPRQTGRLHAENVVFVPHDESAILEALNYVRTDPEFRGRLGECENPFGDGNTGSRVAEILAEVDLGSELMDKRITF